MSAKAPAAAERSTSMAHDLAWLGDISLKLSVEIDRTYLSVRELLNLKLGQVLSTNKNVGEPVELCANDRPFSCGEIIALEEKAGFRIREVLKAHDPSGARI